MNLTTVLLTGAAAALVTATSAVPLRKLATRWELTDQPAENKAHRRPTPYLGGVAIVLGTLTALPAAADSRILAILLGGCAVAVLGLLDDLQPLSPVVRLAVELVIASGVVLNGVQAPLTGHWIDVPVTVLWIVVITNSYNLLDNMDGALAAIAAACCALLAVTALAVGQAGAALLLAALSAACLGFLLHNWAPARMFMGDAGSLFIGFVASSAALLLVTGPGVEGVAHTLLPGFIAVVDTSVVMLARGRNRRALLRGGTDHVSHRLHRIGLSVRMVATTLAALAASSGTLALAVALGRIDPLTAMIAATGTALVLIGLFQSVDVYGRPAPADPSTRPSQKLR